MNENSTHEKKRRIRKISWKETAREWCQVYQWPIVKHFFYRNLIIKSKDTFLRLLLYIYTRKKEYSSTIVSVEIRVYCLQCLCILTATKHLSLLRKKEVMNAFHIRTQIWHSEATRAHKKIILFYSLLR